MLKLLPRLKLVPRHSALALVIPPAVWLGYFVLTFLSSLISCERGSDVGSASGIFTTHRLIWIITLASLALLAMATWQAWRNLRLANEPGQTPEDQPRERYEFLAETGLFLCGISILGVLWGTINVFSFPSCAG